MINGETSSIMAPQNVKPGKDGRDIVRIFKELKQSVTNEWSGVKPSVNEEEKEFLEKKEKLEVLEHRLGDASKQVSKNNHVGRELLKYVISHAILLFAELHFLFIYFFSKCRQNPLLRRIKK